MKILAIRGKNLASLAGDFEVDFENGPLARAGLFAISGPTGAGKSTLLDALCLALYGHTPRLSEGKSAFEIPDGQELSIGVSDPRTILRRGAAEGLAEVVFEGNDGVRYRARWAVKRARKKSGGRLQNAEFEVVNLATEQSLGRTKGEVLEKIREVIGLSFDQFRRSVLLAQGDFAAFLQAKGDERAALLERMTGTEIYGELSKRAYERAKEAKAALDAIEQQKQNVPLMTDEQRKESEARRTALEAELATIGTERTALQVAQQWWTTLASLEGRVAESRTAVDAAESAWNEAAPRRQALSEVESVQELRPLEAAARTSRTDAETATRRKGELEAARAQAVSEEAAAQESVAATRNVLDAAKAEEVAARPTIEQARALDHEIGTQAKAVEELSGKEKKTVDELAAARTDEATLRAKHATETKRLDEANAWIAANPSAMALAGAWNSSVEQLRLFTKHQLDAKKAADEQVVLEKTATTREEERLGLETTWKAATAKYEQAEAEVVRLEAAEQAAPEAPLREKRVAIEARRNAIDALERVRKAATDADAKHRRLVDEATKLETDAASLDGTALTLGKQIEETTARLRQTELLIDRLGVAKYRSLLVHGEECPLCGSLEHPGAATPDQAADVLDHERRDLERALDALKRDEIRQRTEAQANRNRAASLRTEAQALATERDEVDATWREQASTLEGLPSSALVPDAVTALAAVRASMDEALAGVAREEAALAKLRGDTNTARKLRGEALDAERKARAKLDAATTAARDAAEGARRKAAEVTTHREAMDGLLETLQPLFVGRDGWREALAEDARAFGIACDAEVKQARKYEQDATAAKTALSEIEKVLSGIDVRMEGLATALEQIRTTLAAARTELSSCQAVRQTLLGGRPVADLEAALRRAIETAEHAWKTADADAKTIQSKRAGLEGQLGTTASQASELVARAEAAQAALNAALAAAGIDLPTLQSRLARDGAWLASERATMKQLDETRATARGVLQKTQVDLDRHAATARPTQTVEELAALLSGVDARVQSLSETLGAIRKGLEQDDQFRAQAAGLHAEIERLRQKHRTWATVSELIGSADGKKFRTFAQSLTLDLLLAHANGHLAELAPRYRLQRVPKLDLELQVVDRDMGDEIRATNSLSGGETFLVSLALALGLSSLASERVRIESLFIDEGFGSLDPQTLETALATLDALQAAGRKVGLISHVPGLAERIGVQVRVAKQGNGRSEVRVLDASGAAA